MKAAVLGAGSWGTALANVLAENGHDVCLWARSEAVADEINTDHTNERYLPNVRLHEGLQATSDAMSAMSESDMVVLAVPSASLPEVAPLLSAIPRHAILTHAVKGFVRPANRRISEYILEQDVALAARLAVLSGPSHAEEVVAHLPTTVVAASTSRSTAEHVQDAFMNDAFRVYTQSDLVGVELGGTLKNIIALGVGLIDGLGLGDNTKAALMTRGLAEITRLGAALGAAPLTFSGLSGVGDLIVTCTSRHSRNYRAGRLLATGQPLADVLTAIGMAVEGVGTTYAAAELARVHGIEMPITAAIERVLQGLVTPSEAVSRLMRRGKNHEMEDLAGQTLTVQWGLP
ncbi:NAD(P)H-dependent glycerol-3-phosphate dehydrogenase [Alicyclobacillus acidiphilus]|uniref:NAD(P)H-dependent glycerol-3-phosphate dehydrogenase n=1 Tax=Alicyclobacillus acidiphilus TaxID=182455 RepID=UPI00082E9332|nr:NAD(P)H-dependent glycerol-3-phosphate dehydrogenase [Alicyclobacillus acidiphilus]